MLIRSTHAPRFFSAFLAFFFVAVVVKFAWDQWPPTTGLSAALGFGALVGLPVLVFVLEGRKVEISSEGIGVGFWRRRLVPWSEVSFINASEYVAYGHWFRWARVEAVVVDRKDGRRVVLAKSYRNMENDLLRVLEIAPVVARRRFIQKLRELRFLTVTVLQRFPDDVGNR